MERLIAARRLAGFPPTDAELFGVRGVKGELKRTGPSGRPVT